MSFSIDDEDPTPQLELKETDSSLPKKKKRAEPVSTDYFWYAQMFVFCAVLVAVGALVSHWTSAPVSAEPARSGHGFAARETNSALKKLIEEADGFQKRMQQLENAVLRAKGVPTGSPTLKPTGFPTAGFKEQHLHCPDKCSSLGHCCVGLRSGCQHPSCAMGCAIAQTSQAVSECEAACDEADNKCSHTHKGVQLNMCHECPPKCGTAVHNGKCGGAEGGTDGCKLGCQIAFEPK